MCTSDLEREREIERERETHRQTDRQRERQFMHVKNGCNECMERMYACAQICMEQCVRRIYVKTLYLALGVPGHA